jgi:ligand-binding SRPBCC domain-containing protein
VRIEGERSIDITAPAEAVWSLVADVTRMGEWSPHTVQARWVEPAGAIPDDDNGPAVGRQFRGTNRLPIVRRWTSTATVTECDPGRRFAFAVGHNAADPNTVWRYDFEALPGGGTRVTEGWRMLREPAVVLAYYALIGQRARIARGVEETLRRLKAAAERAYES